MISCFPDGNGRSISRFPFPDLDVVRRRKKIMRLMEKSRKKYMCNNVRKVNVFWAKKLECYGQIYFEQRGHGIHRREKERERVSFSWNIII